MIHGIIEYSTLIDIWKLDILACSTSRSLYRSRKQALVVDYQRLWIFTEALVTEEGIIMDNSWVAFFLGDRCRRRNELYFVNSSSSSHHPKESLELNLLSNLSPQACAYASLYVCIKILVKFAGYKVVHIIVISCIGHIMPEGAH